MKDIKGGVWEEKLGRFWRGTDSGRWRRKVEEVSKEGVWSRKIWRKGGGFERKKKEKRILKGEQRKRSEQRARQWGFKTIHIF